MVEIQNANRALYSEIKDTLKDIAQLINRPPQALQTLKKHAPAFAVGGTILGLLGKSDSVSINALPKTKATGTSPHPAAPTESEKVADDYFLTTVPGTAVKDFQNFIRTLPDKGSGPQRHYDLPLQYQTYLGHMTRLDAGIVNRNPMVGFIGLNRRGNVTIQHGCIDTSKEDGIAGRSTSRFNSTRVSTRDAANWVIKQQAGSPLHLRMLSSDPHDLIAFHEFSLNEPQYDYMYEGTEGRGAAIYVVDAGFGLTHQVSLDHRQTWPKARKLHPLVLLNIILLYEHGSVNKPRRLTKTYRNSSDRKRLQRNTIIPQALGPGYKARIMAT